MKPTTTKRLLSGSIYVVTTVVFVLLLQPALRHKKGQVIGDYREYDLQFLYESILAYKKEREEFPVAFNDLANLHVVSSRYGDVLFHESEARRLSQTVKTDLSVLKTEQGNAKRPTILAYFELVDDNGMTFVLYPDGRIEKMLLQDAARRFQNGLE
ncbi:hypothetical protein CA54_31280 [Symmachiella macrocystis]|uniref:Uncharacterized protein n=1 Tax=Symmachiella macrocystis TaxID=2527985 RepID=A0A5C6BU84_9PLAN|nr:hypothetical protein [Symmachiella macrocystis]TWU14284.1 hypothetical protein CA54_31280 [Symmachiella macrocystis]